MTVSPAVKVAYFVLLAGIVLGWRCTAAFSADADALTLERKIPLGDVWGRIDHLAIDVSRHRLFVAELGNNSVGVVDLAEAKLLHRIFGVKEPQGVGYVPSSDTLYVANAGDGSVHRYRGADFAPLGTLKLGSDADNVRVDNQANQVIIGYDKGALAVLDATSGAKMGDIRLAGHPESFHLEPNGARIFVNVPEAQQIAIIDRAAAGQTGKWTVPDAADNFPMAVDQTGERLAVIYRKPAVLAVFDTRDGNVVARLPTCGDADDVFIDAKRQRIYVSCGEGAVDVVQRQGDTYRELGRIATVSGARTSLFVSDLDRLFVAVRATGKERPALWVFRPSAEP
jgi:DNA-binding beta-propeller fold protein YncE